MAGASLFCSMIKLVFLAAGGTLMAGIMGAPSTLFEILHAAHGRQCL